MKQFLTLSFLLSSFLVFGSEYNYDFSNHPGFNDLMKNHLHVGDVKMTREEFFHLYHVWPAHLKNQVESISGNEELKRETAYKLALTRYGFVDSPWDKGAPVGFIPEKENNQLLKPNCMMCHAGVVPSKEGVDKVVFGAPNNRLNLQTLIVDRLMFLSGVYPVIAEMNPDLAVKIADPDFVQQTLNELKQVSALFNMVFPGQNRVYNLSRGVVDPWPSQIITAVLRDRTTGMIDVDMTTGAPTQAALERFIQTTQGNVQTDSDMKPLWHLGVKGKETLWIDGYLKNNIKGLSAPGIPLNVATPDMLAEQWDGPFKNIYDYFKELKAPKLKDYGWEIVKEKADEGHKVFSKRCASCHGQYSLEGDLIAYKDKRIPVSLIGTDPARATALNDAFLDFLSDSYLNFEGESSVNLELKEKRGYVAPPLVGVWATAPYFHNGAVPTLYHVLFPEKRPKVWKASNFKFDESRVGLLVEEFDSPEVIPAPTIITDADGKPVVAVDNGGNDYFNSFLPVGGKSIAGHEKMLKNLSEDDKLKVLEYLKRL